MEKRVASEGRGGVEYAGRKARGGDMSEESVSVSMTIPTKTSWGKLDIPEKTVMKLAKSAGLKYVPQHPRGGGGLCCGLEGVKPRQKALVLLGVLAGKIGAGSTDRALEEAGASWLDVMVWLEDPEYALLWASAERLRDRVTGARTKDALWDRVLNGYPIEEVKKGDNGLEKVTVTRYDNRLGVQMLTGLGLMGKVSVKPKVGGKAGKAGPLGAEPGEEGSGEGPDTVLFADRATAFAAMGKKGAGEGKPETGKG